MYDMACILMLVNPTEAMIRLMLISNGMEKISTRVSFLVCQTRIYTNLRMDLGIGKKLEIHLYHFCVLKMEKNLANHFVAWNEDSHDLTQNPPRALDHCLTDEYIGDVSI